MTPGQWRVRLSIEAELDFTRIIEYIVTTFGPRQSRLYRATVLEALAELHSGPTILGSIPRDEILPGLRTLHVARRGRRGRHFILYRAAGGDLIEVLRILHDAMDLARHIP